MTPEEQETIKAMDEQLARYLVNLLAKSNIPDVLIARINPDQIVEKISSQVADLKLHSDQKFQGLMSRFHTEATRIVDTLPKSLPLAANDKQLAAILVALNEVAGLGNVSEQLAAIHGSLLGDDGKSSALAALNAELIGLKAKISDIAPPHQSPAADQISASITRLDNIIIQMEMLADRLPAAGARHDVGAGATNWRRNFRIGWWARAKSRPPAAPTDDAAAATTEADERPAETLPLDEVAKPVHAPPANDIRDRTVNDDRQADLNKRIAPPWRQVALLAFGIGLGSALMLGIQLAIPPKQSRTDKSTALPQTVLTVLRAYPKPGQPNVDIIQKLCPGDVSQCAALHDVDALVDAKIDNKPMTEAYKLALLQLLVAKAAGVTAAQYCQRPPAAEYRDERKAEALNLLIRCLAAAPAALAAPAPAASPDPTTAPPTLDPPVEQPADGQARLAIPAVGDTASVVAPAATENLPSAALGTTKTLFLS